MSKRSFTVITHSLTVYFSFTQNHLFSGTQKLVNLFFTQMRIDKNINFFSGIFSFLVSYRFQRKR